MLRRTRLVHKLALALFFPVALLALAEVGARLAARLWPPSAGLYDGYEETLVELGGFEDTSRLFEPDPLLFWRLRRSVHGLRWEPPLWLDNRSNALGFRDLERRVARPPDSLRLLCVGDSCTYGSGVRLADTYPQRLEEMLATGLNERLVEVWNTGVPGYSSDQCAVFLEQQLETYQPNLVLVAVGLNDARHWDLGHHKERGHGRCRTDRRNRELVQHPLIQAERLLGRSYLYRLLDRWFRSPASTEENAEDAGGPGSVRVPDHEYRENLRRMQSACAATGSRLVLILWPIKGQIQAPPGEAPDADTTYQTSLREFASEQGVLLIDLVAALRGREGKLYVDSVHMSTTGCQQVAVEIATALHTANLLPLPSPPR